MRSIRHIAIAAVCALALTGAVSSSIGQEPPGKQVIKEWLVAYNNEDARYVRFDHGFIAKIGTYSRRFSQYVDVNHLYLWNCGLPERFNIVVDAGLFLQGKVVKWTDENGEAVAAEYATQCQLGEHAGSVRMHIAAHQ